MRFHLSLLIANLGLNKLGDSRPEYASSSSARDQLYPEHETEPLIHQDPDPSPSDPTARLRTSSEHLNASLAPRPRQLQKLRYIVAVMEKLENSRLAYFANKIAVKSEPGLTNAQLMLHNFDLKPGQ